MSAALHTSREMRVLRRWRAARGALVVRAWARPWFLRRLPLFFVTFLLLAALYVENRVLGIPGGPPLLRGTHPFLRSVAASGVLGYWAVAWIGNLGLAVVLAGLLGRDAASPWVRLGRRLPRWARHLANPWLVAAWAFGVNGLGVLATALWWVAPADLAPLRSLAASGFALLLHLTAALAVWHVVRTTRWWSEGPGRRWTPILLPTVLAPGGIGLVAVLLLLLASPAERRGSSHVGSAFSRTMAPGRLPRWKHAQGLVSERWATLPWWRRPLSRRGPPRRAPEGALRTRVELLSLCRVWALFGFFTAYLVADLCAPAAPGLRVGRSCRVPVGALQGISLLALLVGAVWLAVELVGRLAALLRLRPLRLGPPIGWYAVLEPAAILAGLLLGGQVHMAPPGELAVVTVFLGAIFATLGGMIVMLRTLWSPGGSWASSGWRDPVLLWSGVFLVAPTLLALGLVFGGEGALGTRRVLRAIGWAALLAQPLLGVFLLPRLLRPFTPKDVGSAALAPASRLLLAVLTAAAVVPFGGLAAPLWIDARWRRLDDPELARRALRFAAWTPAGRAEVAR